ncbi:hypothetical protein TPHA_0G02330 [Tetrapisispora phaffii CBS 4417]|uniref:Uncharacterized protein n=1 Tax=Tetrapisispora phaffii (strain ATCC 24235 / CBS 4417 / NBRC 1672 / NRRL Y-8282 / UCD 70-5) TaxID=1071381 RepID=G8BVZ1_TETPH|nr:hypothetical protein TPHA_0G02330 [Tetrapisispora phaffii CBS 4417]CCE64069.1 hypothetical protein TPHA_0G02330 [Tetrapisispora phaffii CBS 4417]
MDAGLSAISRKVGVPTKKYNTMQDKMNIRRNLIDDGTYLPNVTMNNGNVNSQYNPQPNNMMQMQSQQQGPSCNNRPNYNYSDQNNFNNPQYDPSKNYKMAPNMYNRPYNSMSSNNVQQPKSFSNNSSVTSFIKKTGSTLSFPRMKKKDKHDGFDDDEEEGVDFDFDINISNPKEYSFKDIPGNIHKKDIFNHDFSMNPVIPTQYTNDKGRMSNSQYRKYKMSQQKKNLQSQHAINNQTIRYQNVQHTQKNYPNTYMKSHSLTNVGSNYPNQPNNKNMVYQQQQYGNNQSNSMSLNSLYRNNIQSQRNWNQQSAGIPSGNNQLTSSPTIPSIVISENRETIKSTDFQSNSSYSSKNSEKSTTPNTSAESLNYNLNNTYSNKLVMDQKNSPLRNEVSSTSNGITTIESEQRLTTLTAQLKYKTDLLESQENLFKEKETDYTNRIKVKDDKINSLISSREEEIEFEVKQKELEYESKYNEQRAAFEQIISKKDKTIEQLTEYIASLNIAKEISQERGVYQNNETILKTVNDNITNDIKKNNDVYANSSENTKVDPISCSSSVNDQSIDNRLSDKGRKISNNNLNMDYLKTLQAINEKIKNRDTTDIDAIVTHGNTHVNRLLKDNQALTEELTLISEELVNSISREISLDKTLKELKEAHRNNEHSIYILKQELETEIRKKSKTIIELIKKLNDERVKRFIADERLITN